MVEPGTESSGTGTQPESEPTTVVSMDFLEFLEQLLAVRTKVPLSDELAGVLSCHVKILSLLLSLFWQKIQLRAKIQQQPIFET